MKGERWQSSPGKVQVTEEICCIPSSLNKIPAVCFCWSLWLQQRGASSLVTPAWATFLIFLKGSQQIPHLHGYPLTLQCLNQTSWFQESRGQEKSLSYILHFLPHPAPGHFWAQDTGTVVSVVWPATAGFHDYHHVSAFKGFYFWFVEFYVPAFGGEWGSLLFLFLSLLSLVRLVKSQKQEEVRRNFTAQLWARSCKAIFCPCL